MEFYNEQRTHFSLDMKHAEAPLMAFHNKKVPDEIMKSTPKWMEEDPMTSGTNHMCETDKVI